MSSGAPAQKAAPCAREAPGGGFLAWDGAPGSPEPGDEARALGQSARDFVRRRVLTQNRALEAGDRALLRSLLAEAGAADLLGAEIPTAYGGLGLPPDAASAIVSGLGHQASFAVSCAAHLTIGTVPLLRHAEEPLKHALLPLVASGERIGAYALTEAGGGSDALALKTRAIPRPGGFALSGEKVFITNAKVADHFVVVALVEGKGPSAFLIDAHAPGLTLGREERKLGLHGSSTCALRLDEVPVDEAQLLGALGHGHRVALDALAVGRHKLGVLASGHLELLLEVGASYAAERQALGRPIGERALVAELLAESIARAYALRAVVARAAPLCAPDAAEPTLALVEAALCKVLGSEALCAGADAMLQIHGGLGYLAGTWVEQSYRDVRVNRIYEGTDEINRRAIADGLLRSLRRGRLLLDGEAATEMLARPARLDPTPLALAGHVRRLAVAALSAAQGIEGDREAIEGALADLALAAYASDSVARSAARAIGDPCAELFEAAALLACAHAVERAHSAYGAIVGAGVSVCIGAGAGAGISTGVSLPHRGLSLLDVAPGLDRGALRTRLARAALDAGGDPLIAYTRIRPPLPDAREGA